MKKAMILTACTLCLTIGCSATKYSPRDQLSEMIAAVNKAPKVQQFVSHYLNTLSDVGEPMEANIQLYDSTVTVAPWIFWKQIMKDYYGVDTSESNREAAFKQWVGIRNEWVTDRYENKISDTLWKPANENSIVVAFVSYPHERVVSVQLVPNRDRGLPLVHRLLARNTATLQAVGLFNVNGHLEHIYFDVVHID
jgi:hypothetical protein